jgi:hypothetical protein
MSQDERSPARKWQEIAAEASREKEPQKLLQLTEELERALENRYAKLRVSAQGSTARKA